MDKSISQTLAEIREKAREPKEYVDPYNDAGFLKHPESMKEGREEVTLAETDVLPQVYWQDSDKN